MADESCKRHAMTDREASPKKNPFFGDGDREKWELECMRLVRRLAELTGEDPFDVIARASSYKGGSHKLNPANMTDDRLINTVRDLRADVAAEEKKRGQDKRTG